MINKMKKLVYLLSAFALFGLTSCNADDTPTSSNELAIGSKIPKAELKMKDITGDSITLKEAFKERGLLVMFSCNTCPYVIKNQDRTREISRFALENNFGVILINANE